MSIARITAVVSGKGGVGKTTSVTNLGEALAGLGKRTLLVDADPQNGLAIGLGLEELADTPGCLELLLRGGDLASCVAGLDSEGLDVLCAGTLKDQVQLDELLSRQPARFSQLFELLTPRYDEILIDCPAGFGPLTQASLAAAHQALLPVQCHPLALRTLPSTLEAIQRGRETHNAELRLGGLFLTMYDPMLDAKLGIAEQIWRDFPATAVYKTAIPQDHDLISQYGGGGPAVYSSPQSSAALAYAQLAREFCSRP